MVHERPVDGGDEGVERDTGKKMPVLTGAGFQRTERCRLGAIVIASSATVRAPALGVTYRVDWDSTGAGLGLTPGSCPRTGYGVGSFSTQS
jgi:hypothetical protein